MNQHPKTSGFSFMNLISPKANKLISFEQPNQANNTTNNKRSALDAYSKKNKNSLPVGFSDQVLEYEMELEKEEVSIEVVNKLTDLYTQAMAFYESEGSHRYKYFNNKLQELLLKPNVKESMMKEISPTKTSFEEKEIRRIRLENQISRVNAEKEAFTLVKSQEDKEKEINKVLERNLSSQKDRIKKRIAERKAKHQSRALSLTCISDDNMSSTDEKMQDLEQELENLPKLPGFDKLNQIEEVDEAGYATPPRKRNKDGQMIFFEKGKKNHKTFLFEEDKEIKRNIRRHSFSKEKPVINITQKRNMRAQSFGTKTFPFPFDKLKIKIDESNDVKQKVNSENNEKNKEEVMNNQDHSKENNEEPKTEAIIEEDKKDNIPESENEIISENVTHTQVDEQQQTQIENESVNQGTEEEKLIGCEENQNKNEDITSETRNPIETHEANVKTEIEEVKESSLQAELHGQEPVQGIGSDICDQQVEETNKELIQNDQPKDEDNNSIKEIEEIEINHEPTEVIRNQELLQNEELIKTKEISPKEVENEKNMLNEKIVQEEDEETARVNKTEEEKQDTFVQNEEKEIPDENKTEEIQRGESENLENEEKNEMPSKEIGAHEIENDENILNEEGVQEENKEEIIPDEVETSEEKQKDIVQKEEENEEKGIQIENKTEEVQEVRAENVESEERKEAFCEEAVVQETENDKLVLTEEIIQEEIEESTIVNGIEEKKQEDPAQYEEKEIATENQVEVELQKEQIENEENHEKIEGIVENGNSAQEEVETEKDETLVEEHGIDQQKSQTESNLERIVSIQEATGMEGNDNEKEQAEEVKSKEEDTEIVGDTNPKPKTRGRTDSELADAEKLALLKKIEEDQKNEMEQFLKEQEMEKEEVLKKIEEKYDNKRKVMEEEMDSEEKEGAMWQKVLNKLSKDKDSEKEEALEKLADEQAQGLEKYKKKLQQQKMFKLAQLSSE